MNKWQILLDIGMLAAPALIVFLAIKQGFIKSFFRSTKLLIVIIITFIIGTCIVGACQERIVTPILDGKITYTVVRGVKEVDGDLDFNKLIDKVPATVKGFLPLETVEQYFNSLSGTKEQIATKVGEKIEGIAIRAVSKFIAYIGTFILVYIVCTMGVMMLEKFGNLPILSNLNRLFGVVWGVCSAYLFVSFAVCVVLVVFGIDFIEGTMVTRIIYRLGLFTH